MEQEELENKINSLQQSVEKKLDWQQLILIILGIGIFLKVLINLPSGSILPIIFCSVLTWFLIKSLFVVWGDKIWKD